MFFKGLLAVPRLTKIIKKPPVNPQTFKEINWSLGQQNEQRKQLSKSVQTIVDELENTSTADAQGPVLKK